MSVVPSPDTPVQVLNAFYERQTDGSWRAWVEPLGGDEPKQRLFESAGADVDTARDAMCAAYLAHLDGLSEDAVATWYLIHAVQVAAHRTYGDRPWPPPTGFCRNLDAIEP